MTKKGLKWAGLDFFRTAIINFLKEDHKISFYTNKRAMLRSLGGGQIKKIHKNGGGQYQSFKIIINENFLARSTEAKSVRATISKICAKTIKI